MINSLSNHSHNIQRTYRALYLLHSFSLPVPFQRFEERKKQIQSELKKEGFEYNQYEIIEVPNITHITYGRDVGYKIEQEHFEDEIESISATEIRKQMNK